MQKAQCPNEKQNRHHSVASYQRPCLFNLPPPPKIRQHPPKFVHPPNQQRSESQLLREGPIINQPAPVSALRTKLQESTLHVNQQGCQRPQLNPSQKSNDSWTNSHKEESRQHKNQLLAQKNTSDH
ncbi:hypothetical protein DAPPUDRAFT_252792 [Daphnia pulex]|uniref:Uncharacterized protein n=1 Tax=Daphnia pulex TaxID=6669 RepID=E9H3G9_DAPPU|nr:hypothetical protein DAPPUDRAFT_252792 [Daphnia pulex]|eukprot:EFX73770.1 hypothetical protein DAPPUDRAFT_252792 [Daphnia pulex]